MKHVYLCGLAALMLLLMAACESGATFEVKNECSFPAWISVENKPMITLAAGETRSFKIDTDTQNIFTGSVYHKFPVVVYGETFTLTRLVDGRLIDTDTTNVEIQAGETRHAPLIPNRASIKVINNSSTPILRAEIWKHTSLSQIPMGSISNVQPGEAKYKRVEYATPNNVFYYVVRLYLQGEEEPLYYGGEENILGLDEQFLVTYADPE